MTNSPLHRDQGERLPKPAEHSRRRRRRIPRRGTVGPVRPGRFFRCRHQIDGIRRDMKPYDLGDCDWLLYRRPFNPYHRKTFKSKAYERGFADSKRSMPKPTWRPIP